MEKEVALNSYPELMALDVGDFVYVAYQLVLGRKPDDAGMNYYSARLRTGYSRLSVLHQLGTSGEQPNLDGLPGLRQTLRRYRLSRLPLVGWVFRSFWRMEGEHVSQRLLRVIASEQADLRNGLSELRTAMVARDELMRNGLSELRTVMVARDELMRNGMSDLRTVLIARDESMRALAAVFARPRTKEDTHAGQPICPSNFVAERLSPRAKEIFEQLVSS